MYSNDEMYYSGEEARIHTRDMVNKMRKMGINILSYYISRYERDDDGDYMQIPRIIDTNILLTDVSSESALYVPDSD